ncbi:Pimeloyl-ACP methyl ester carboxylesterase [Rhodococcus rhodochrous J3]|uniref:Pimeloyl-ACP methyl ester carboxylesterase n=1 Tax=Rhodococcus rhodochrous J3 TaxID=903528 RepID=A0ABY1MF07_RHORH|nr:alpha/beta hydrolase [Rhodococcus rhodochrous]AYA24344.1 alpha/beta hydrolase [Rhodococcus rhodochrous]MBF4480311.1 alpha/beta hydrolase [Rhodococcus rhodochrous]MCD2097384.1 alpha/beta hydrolase [Rhodococcus rhodochrous]MCD2122700.1 alpha/beta hydrolase [Rhodococcus rhodochrous]MCQ4133496.1 alpha/beta hydrolase [Rhodococcus rhodochrous]
MIEARYLEIGGALGFVEIVTPDARSGNALDATDLPTVLCIHTAGQSGVQWRHVARDLADRGYRVIVPDLPGHGRSEPAPGGPVTSLIAYGDWLCAVLDALGIDRPFVMGCSIGGKLTLELATRPDRPLSGAVAMEAEPGPGRVNVAGLRRELEDVAGPSRSERTYLGTLASVGRSVPEAKAHTIALMHKREDPEISSSDLIGWGTHDVRDRLDRVTAPIHLVAGVDDPWIDPDAVARAADTINDALPGRARFTALAGIGHYPMEEIDDFAALADTWIGELRRVAVPEEAAL